MSSSFSGPHWSTIIVTPCLGFVAGCFYAVVTKVPNELVLWSGLVFTIQTVADVILYQIAHACFGNGGARSAKLYAATNLTANVTAAVLLFRWQVIGHIGLAVFTGLMGVNLAFQALDFSRYRTVA